MTLCISSKLHRQLVAMAAASPDQEICGLLIGSQRVERLIPTRNVAVDPRRAFEIEPETLFAAIRAERAGGEKLIGYYHSHPAGRPAPSPKDAAQATADGRIWVIIGEQRVTAWVMTTAGNFMQVSCQIDD